MKMKIIILCGLIWASYFVIAQGQIRSDFVLADNGLHPCIVIDKEGHLHATWGSLEGVYYALFDSLGSPIISPYRISGGDCFFPRIALSTEYAVLVWWFRTIFEQDYIMGEEFSLNGQSVSESMKFNDYGTTPDVCFLNDSIFAVVWCGNGLTTSEVFGQISNTSPQFIGKNVLLSDHGSRNVNYGNARVLRKSDNDDFIVIWRDDHLGSNKVFGRLFYSDGAPKDSSFLISEDSSLTNMWFLSADIDTSGDFAVVWGGAQDSLWQIQWRWFHNDGTPLAPTKSITSDVDSVLTYSCTDVAIDLEGKSVVVWEQKENGYSKIFAQRFLPDRTPLGSSFRVSVVDDTSDQYFPTVELYQDKIYNAWQQVKYPDNKIWANIIDFDNPPAHVETEPTHFPKSFRLHQNYPNPFNSITVIKYEVSRRSHVSFVIYNLLGEKIITLVNKEVRPGTYEVQWNSKNFKGGYVPSGIYLYRLTVDVNTQTRKMVLVR